MLINAPGPLTFANNGPLTLSGTGGQRQHRPVADRQRLDRHDRVRQRRRIAQRRRATTRTASCIAAPFTGPIALRSHYDDRGDVDRDRADRAADRQPVVRRMRRRAVDRRAAPVCVIAAPVSGSVSNEGSVSVGTTRGVSYDDGADRRRRDRRSSASASRQNVGGGFVNDRYYIDANSNGRHRPASVDTTVDTLVTGTRHRDGHRTRRCGSRPSATNPQPVTLGVFGTGADGAMASSTAARSRRRSPMSAWRPSPCADRRRRGDDDDDSAVSTTSRPARSSGTASTRGPPAIDLLAGANVPTTRQRRARSARRPARSPRRARPRSGRAAMPMRPRRRARRIAADDRQQRQRSAATATGTQTTARPASSTCQGSVTSITNSGTISATIATGSTGGAARAIDLSAGNQARSTFVNSGTITGSVYLEPGTGDQRLLDRRARSAARSSSARLRRQHACAERDRGSFTGTLTDADADRRDARRHRPAEPRRRTGDARLDRRDRRVDAGRAGDCPASTSLTVVGAGELHRHQHDRPVAPVAGAQPERHDRHRERRDHDRPSADAGRCVERAVSVHRDRADADADDAVDRPDTQDGGRRSG